MRVERVVAGGVDWGGWGPERGDDGARIGGDRVEGDGEWGWCSGRSKGGLDLGEKG